MKKQNAMQRLLRSSKNYKKIVKLALKKVEPRLLMKLVEVMNEQGYLIGSPIDKLTSRTVYEIEHFSKPEYLLSANDSQLFYISLGIGKVNIAKIRKFVLMEKELKKYIYSGNYFNAIEVLNKIDEIFGRSKWSSKIKISLNVLSDDSYRYDNKTDDATDVVTLLLKIHYESATNSGSEDSTSQQVFDFYTDDQSYQSYEWIKYQIVGDYPGVPINYPELLSAEIFGTLVDFYKALEFACLETIALKNNNDYYQDCCDFLRLAGLESLILKRTEDLVNIKHEQLSVFDAYTRADYLDVVDELFENDLEDIGIFTIFSKSLFFLKCRVVEDTLMHKLSNLMANVYEKKDGYLESVNRIINFAIIFPGIEFYQNLIRLVLSEYRPDLKRNSNDVRIFSNVVTPLRLSLQFSKEHVFEYFENNTVLSDTYELFKKVHYENEGGFRNLSGRDIKYIARNLVQSNKFDSAVELYKCNNMLADPSLCRDYLISLVEISKIGEAMEFFNSLLDEFPDAEYYFSIKKLHEALYLRAYGASSILIPITLYRYRLVEDGSKNRTATALSIASYVRGIGLRYPSEITNFEDENIGYFLEFVCSRDMLIKSMMFEYQSDAYDERIKICNLLIENRIGNEDKILFEAKELSKKKALLEAERQVSSSKVYADKDYIRTETWDEFDVQYRKYIEGDLDIEALQNMYDSVTKEDESLARNSNIGKKFAEEISQKLNFINSIGKVKENQLFYSMMKIAVDAYCFGLKGLNGYLGTRIRHGTCETTLLIPLAKLSLYLDGELRQENDFISRFDFASRSVKEKIFSLQKKLNLELSDMVDHLINVMSHVTTNEKVSNNAAFDFNVKESVVVELRAESGLNPSVDECWNEIFRWIDRRTEIGCMILQEELDDFLTITIKKLSDFEDALKNVLSDYETQYGYGEIIVGLNQAKRSMAVQVNTVKGWFEYDKTMSDQDYDMAIVLDIVENMLGVNIGYLESCKSYIVPNNYLSSMVDIVHNLASNALKHSTLERNDVSLEFDILDSSNLYKFNLTNSTKYIGDIGIENERLKYFVEEKMKTDIQEIIQSAGGTGVARIIGIFQHDLSSTIKIELSYLNQDEFSSVVCVTEGCGVFKYENIDSRG